MEEDEEVGNFKGKKNWKHKMRKFVPVDCDFMEEFL